MVTATLKAVDSQLVMDGGVHRYRDDEFYGGGQWPVLAGAYAALSHVDTTSRQQAIQWIEEQADENGNLPEQSPTHLRNPHYLEPWVDRWGPVARPLLWSHAMYLIANQEFRQRDGVLTSFRRATVPGRGVPLSVAPVAGDQNHGTSGL